MCIVLTSHKNTHTAIHEMRRSSSLTHMHTPHTHILSACRTVAHVLRQRAILRASSRQDTGAEADVNAQMSVQAGVDEQVDEQVSLALNVVRHVFDHCPSGAVKVQALCALLWMEQGDCLSLQPLLCTLVTAQGMPAHGKTATASVPWPRSSCAVIIGQLLHRATLDSEVSTLLLQVSRSLPLSRAHLSRAHTVDEKDQHIPRHRHTRRALTHKDSHIPLCLRLHTSVGGKTGHLASV